MTKDGDAALHDDIGLISIPVAVAAHGNITNSEDSPAGMVVKCFAESLRDNLAGHDAKTQKQRVHY